MTYKSVHDPLYGFIDLSELEIHVIDSAVFRRLHRIKQLAQANAVYPSASHARFEHSLGVCHLAGRMAKHLEFDDKMIRAVRLAALLHDVGHGPFSHIFEPVLSSINHQEISHEEISQMMITKDPELSGILGELAPQVASILAHKPVPGWTLQESMLAADVISGPLDVDRMDYLRRDSYHLGVDYGHFDLDQLLHTITTTKDTGERWVAVNIKGWGAVEQYRLGRYLMHAQVYQHHTIVVANRMCIDSMLHAVGSVIGPDELLVDSPDFLDNYTKLDDQSLSDRILSSDGVAAKIMGRLRRRDLLKRVCEIYPGSDIPDPKARLKMAKMNHTTQQKVASEIAHTLHLAEHDIVVHTSHIPVHHNEDQILVIRDGVPRHLNDSSPIISSHSPIDKFYIFGPDNKRVRDTVRDYMCSEFGIMI